MEDERGGCRGISEQHNNVRRSCQVGPVDLQELLLRTAQLECVMVDDLQGENNMINEYW